MNLESLANEMLLELFEYFHTVDLLHTFYGLNPRFDTLLFVYFRHFHLDFRSISKNNFDFICRQHLPSIADRIVSFCLSDDNDTPQQAVRFLSQSVHILQFINLRSLSLYHIQSDLLFHTLIDECHHIPHLTHLNLIECDVGWRDRSSRLIDEIWRLSKLTHCRIRNSNRYYKRLSIPTVVSSSLKFFAIDGYIVYLQKLASLIERTPHLRRLHVHISNQYESNPLQFTFATLKFLKITNTGSVQQLMSFLQNIPNLRHLTVKTLGRLDGHRWEQLITDCLPKLKVFRLKMEFPIHRNKEQKLDELLNSFHSRFWLNERRWFVRCHWYSDSVTKHACLYTLPYAFSEFVLSDGMLTRSTCPDEDDHCSYDHVQNLSYSSSPSTLRFCNIHHLYLRFPFNEQFWSIVPKLDRLISMRLSMCNYDEASLQALLERAPHLSSLIYDSSSSLTPKEVLLLNSNLIIRRLDLQGYEHWFNEEECTQLSQSSLGIHCEVLRIKVQNRTSILHFVETMANLRALNVQCQDDDRVDGNHVDKNDAPYDDDLNVIFLPRQEELVKWLQHRLSTEFLISREINKLDNIRLWLR